MKKYADYFFAQCEEADEYIEMLNTEGAQGFLDYLDSAGLEIGETWDGEGVPWGQRDVITKLKGCVIAVNYGIHYIGVYVEVKP